MTTTTRENESTEPGRTIIVALDLESHLSPALELALALASMRQGALHGLFIEDEDLFQAARLPFAAEVLRLGGKPRALESRQLERSLQQTASRFRDLLARQAEQRALAWSYSSVRARRHSMNLDDHRSADYFVMSQPQGRRARPAAALRLLLVRDHSPSCLQALEVVLAQNPDRQVELYVLDEAGENREMENAALRQLLTDHPQTVARTLPSAKLAEALSAGAGLHCIVTSRTIEPELLRQILRRATCPVVVAA